MDIGAANFGVSSIELDDGIYEVKAVSGKTNFGGIDLVNKMTDHFVEEFKLKHKKDLTNNLTSMRKLRNACERLKIALSDEMEASIEIESLFEGISFHSSMTRAKFEDLNKKFFESVLKQLDNLKVSKVQVNRVVLVGGSSKMPKIKSLLFNYFNANLVFTLEDENNVAIGASIQGAILSGTKSVELDNILMIDVLSHSISLDFNGGKNISIFPKNVSIPVKKELNVSTQIDNQNEILFFVNLKGKTKSENESKFLDKYRISGIAPAPRGCPNIKIDFSIDTNGILQISALDLSYRGKISVDNNLDGGRLNYEEINNLKIEVSKKIDIKKYFNDFALSFLLSTKEINVKIPKFIVFEILIKRIFYFSQIKTF